MKNEKNERIRKKLKKSSVGIAGLGGLGSNAAIALARSGIGRLVLVDFDIIEKSNLNRQYFFLNQIGKPKTLALKENIRNVNPDVIIDAFNVKLEKGSMEKYFKDVDVIIEALDKAEMKTNFIEEILNKLLDKPVIGASGVAGYGHSDRIITKKIGNLFLCYDEHAKSSEEDILMAPRVGIMANWEANLAVEIILGENI
jgi:sulfur carrier protein ThiS adenylyltransferase